MTEAALIPFSRSLHTKLLLIVLLFIGVGSVLSIVRQSVLETERLEERFDYRMMRLGQRYQARMTDELQQRRQLLESSRTTLAQHLDDVRGQPAAEGFVLERDSDGHYRRYDRQSAVFVPGDVEITPQLLHLAFHSAAIWEYLVPLLATNFDSVYFVSAERMMRVWPLDVVRSRPSHGLSLDLFYAFAGPGYNPEREVRWTPIYFDPFANVWMLSLLVPLYGGDEFRGYIGADIDMTFLFDRMDELYVDGEGLQSFIFDDDGNLVLHSRHARILLREQQDDYSLLNVEDSITPGTDTFISAVLRGDLASEEIHSHKLFGEPSKVSVHQLDAMNWHFALHYPRSRITNSVRTTMGAVHKNTLLMAILFAIVLYGGLRYFVTNRITRLARATTNVNITQWQEYVPDAGSDEISQMGRSINAMLDKINDLFRGLNDNILNMEQLAYYDQLTGLQNRVHFKEQLRAGLHACDRDKHHLALMYLDLDHFKRINDTLGHEAGDKLLSEVATRLRQCLREDDAVARLGGDEFAILLQRVDSAQFAFTVADKIIAALNTPMQLVGQEVVVGVSIGITMAPDDSSDADSLMKNADLAMYQAKEKGRNAAQFYTTDMNFEVENRLNLERELRSAIRNHEFELYYQPQIDFRTGEIVGAEALMRWHHPKKGLVSPLDFIPVAEDSGLIVPMGRWALYQACQQARNIHKALGRAIRISVNVSARQLRDDGFAVDVAHALNESRLEPQWLELEVTESALMEQGDKAIERLAQLRAMGVNLAIDDFGTGYSSLSHLKRLPVTRLKVDRSFVQDLPDDEEDRAITSLIVAMANSLYYEVVVEGVEIQAQLVFLARCGCDYVQGFYFSRPVPADELLVLLFDWKPDAALRQIFT